MKWVNRKSFIKSELHFQPRSHGELSRHDAELGTTVIGSLLAFGSWLSQRIVVVVVSVCSCAWLLAFVILYTFGKGKKTCNQLAARSTLHFLILPFGVFHSSVHLLHYHSFALFSPRHSSPSSVCLPFSPFSYFFPGCSFSFQLTFLHSMFGIPEFLFALCALVLALQQTTPAPIDAFLTR